MEPQLIATDDLPRLRYSPKTAWMLQWSRSLSPRMIELMEVIVEDTEVASMEPQLIATDDLDDEYDGRNNELASMEPQLIATDDRSSQIDWKCGESASMEPQLIATDDRDRENAKSLASDRLQWSRSLSPRMILHDLLRRSLGRNASMEPQLIATDDRTQ